MLIFGWNTENIHWEKEKLSIFHGNFRLQYHRIADPMSGKTACVWKRKMWELALLQKKNRHHRRHQAKNLVILKPLVSKPERCRHGKKSGFPWTPETATPNRISSRRGTHPRAERIPCWPRLRNCNQVDQTPFALTRTKAWRILWINSLLDRSLRRGDFGFPDNVF